MPVNFTSPSINFINRHPHPPPHHFQTQRVPMASPARQAGDEPQLPDLDIIARGYQSIATELPKFRNVPAFDQGAEILNEMRGMREEMRRMNEKIDREMQRVNEKIDREMQRVNEKIDRFDGRFGAMYAALPSFLPQLISLRERERELF
jgi:hypothetical protein